jgi:hypothetical protein
MTGRRAWRAFSILALGACAPSADTLGGLPAHTSWPVAIDLDGGAFQESGPPLGPVGQVLLGPDGEVIVAQGSEVGVRVYSSGGGYLRTIGGVEEGPGGVTRPGPIGIRGDTLLVASTGRITLFSLGGNLLRTEALAGEGFSRGELSFSPQNPREAVLLDDGDLLVTPSFSLRQMPSVQDDVVRWSLPIPYLRLSPSSGAMKELAWGVQEGVTVLLDEGASSHTLSSPFRDDPILTLMPDGGGVVLVERGEGNGVDGPAFRVMRIAPGGDTVFSVRIPYEPLAASREWVRWSIDQVRPGAEGSPTATRWERAFRRAGAVPSAIPPVTGLVGGQDGTVWVRREDTGAAQVRWDVLGGGGEMLGSVMLPRSRAIRAARLPHLVVVEPGEFDVPSLIRYRVER